MRADAQKNYDHLIAVARKVITEQGADASLRDIARQAEVGLGTLYRHFPTREALLEALLRTGFDQITATAAELEESTLPADALVNWLRVFIDCAQAYRGVIATMTAAIADPQSALHAACHAMRASGARLLARAQAAGAARPDLDGQDLFALSAALAWAGDQPPFAPRSERMFQIVVSAILTAPPAHPLPPADCSDC